MGDAWYSMADCKVYSRLRWLARYHDNEECVYPSIKQLCKDLRLSKRQVIDSLQVLEDGWLIYVYHRWYKRRNNYEIVDLDNYPCEIWY